MALCFTVSFSDPCYKKAGNWLNWAYTVGMKLVFQPLTGVHFASGEGGIVWQDTKGNGLKFVDISVEENVIGEEQMSLLAYPQMNLNIQ